MEALSIETMQQPEVVMLFALMDALKWLEYYRDSGDVLCDQKNSPWRFKLSRKLSSSFAIATCSDGDWALLARSMSNGCGDWFAALPWSGVYINKRRTMMALSCPPITLPQNMSKPGVTPSTLAFCLDLAGHPKLISQIAEASVVRVGLYSHFADNMVNLEQVSNRYVRVLTA